MCITPWWIANGSFERKNVRQARMALRMVSDIVVKKYRNGQQRRWKLNKMD